MCLEDINEIYDNGFIRTVDLYLANVRSLMALSYAEPPARLPMYTYNWKGYLGGQELL